MRRKDKHALGKHRGGGGAEARPLRTARSTCVSHCDHSAYSGSARAPLGSAAAAPGKRGGRRGASRERRTAELATCPEPFPARTTRDGTSTLRNIITRLNRSDSAFPSDSTGRHARAAAPHSTVCAARAVPAESCAPGARIAKSDRANAHAPSSPAHMPRTDAYRDAFPPRFARSTRDGLPIISTPSHSHLVLRPRVLGPWFFIVSPPPAAATAAAARLTGLSRRLVSHPTVVSWRGYAPRHGRW